jgi:4-hydroxybenzoate polyprenyltransferase
MIEPPRTPEATETDLPPARAAAFAGAGAGAPSGMVADAPPGNWVDRLAPPATRPFLRLSRADRPIGTWLLLIPCLWGIALAAADGGFRAWDGWLALSCAAGAFLMRGAGCTWNDLSDRDFDAQVARTRSRPLPSGQVTPRAAAVWMVLQAVLAAGILFSYNALAIGLGIASLGLVAVYPFAKRFTWWPQAFLGLAFNWGALLAYAAHAGQVGWAAVLLYFAGVAWTLFYDTIYAHQDKEDDALIGVRSTARLFGQNSRPWLRGFLVAAVLLMAAAVLVAWLPQGNPLALALALGGVWGFGWHLAWQLGRLDTEDPQSCMMLFRSNRDAGLIAALFLAVAAFL